METYSLKEIMSDKDTVVNDISDDVIEKQYNRIRSNNFFIGVIQRSELIKIDNILYYINEDGDHFPVTFDAYKFKKGKNDFLVRDKVIKFLCDVITEKHLLGKYQYNKKEYFSLSLKNNEEIIVIYSVFNGTLKEMNDYYKV